MSPERPREPHDPAPASRRWSGRLTGVIEALRWAAMLVGLAVAALFLSWHALASVDFGYGVWYDVLEIDETIATYGPENHHRPGFHHTDRAERERLFGAIVDAIHRNGAGLEELTYHLPDGRAVAPLLTPPEIVHLEDVARLVNALNIAGVAGTVTFLLLAAHAGWRHARPPSGIRIAAVTGGVLVTGTAVILLIGPVRVFYGLHEVIFPADNPWFFYYEDSLMSMMMQAPNLFGPIAAVWVLLALLPGAIIWFTLARFLCRRSGASGAGI
ncbi:DUF1461 domain-containing protein [Thioalkalivibrio sp. ALR17-21]|uniref:lipoprotein intramolecular transacylase Lit n=1 Tax=Thioalkalivibrio sp. ALR17-21 TaxID=1269813 RepID=UPI00040B1EAB|nr:DUF1461 domain-containing protein [Thioalkalivibrio sp. ALR17-21]